MEIKQVINYIPAVAFVGELMDKQGAVKSIQVGTAAYCGATFFSDEEIQKKWKIEKLGGMIRGAKYFAALGMVIGYAEKLRRARENFDPAYYEFDERTKKKIAERNEVLDANEAAGALYVQNTQPGEVELVKGNSEFCLPKFIKRNLLTTLGVVAAIIIVAIELTKANRKLLGS